MSSLSFEVNGFDDVCKSGLVSNCCGADMYSDSDICPDCGEHCEAEEEENEEEEKQ